MKALVTDRGILARTGGLLTGKTLRKGVKEADIPRPTLSKNEILVKVRATALNPIDFKFIDFLAPPGNIAGCDFSGVVEEVGEQVVRSWKVNDRVAGFVQGGIDIGRGAFAEYVKIDADLVWAVPSGVSDEQAATYGISAVTAMQGLQLHLDVPWPDETVKQQQSPKPKILIYGGSSTVGLFAIQIAKIAGYEVVTTASPHSFELVKKYGADHVFEYHHRISAQEIAQAHPGLTRALDCYSEGNSTLFCAQVLQQNGGKVVTLVPNKAAVPGVEVVMVMSFQLLGHAFAWVPPIGPKYAASDADRAALARFYAILGGLTDVITAPPVTEVGSGFQGILEGLDKLRAKQVSGSKLVVKL